MVKKKKRERYSVIISSLTDARKKPFVFSISKRKLIFVICAIFVIVTASAGAAALTSSSAIISSVEADALKAQSEGREVVIDSYSNKLIELKQSRYLNGIDSEGMKAIYKETGLVSLSPETSLSPQAPEEIAALPPKEEAVKGSLLPLSPGRGVSIKNLGPAIESIPMTEAIEKINADFQADIDKRIEEIKINEGFGEAEVIYNENEDGDGNQVNNWADVLSIYAVITMRDELRFMTITPENLKLLKKIYNEMNQPSFYTKTAPYTEESGTESDSENRSESGTESIIKIKLTIYVNVNSLTYSEDAELHDFDRKQKRKLEQLMSPSWYPYFADVLGLDVYDGMKSEELQAIIAALPEGTKGSEIVKVALIRLGHPYSNGRRGSGNYVDCSYLTRWAYEQAGLTIPTSSVLQAQYCFRNGYVVERKDLQPGDLVFWSKKICNCGRWREIHHAGIYIGSNKVIEASRSRGRVVIRNLWSSSDWKLAFFARPFTQDDKAGIEPVSEVKPDDKTKEES